VHEVPLARVHSSWVIRATPCRPTPPAALVVLPVPVLGPQRGVEEESEEKEGLGEASVALVQAPRPPPSTLSVRFATLASR
jgi:hypothetical protein